MPTLSLVENVAASRFLGAYQPLISRKKARIIDLVEIVDHAPIPAHFRWAKAARCRARALVNDPHLIIADEPTNLDSVTAETILQIFEKLVSQGAVSWSHRVSLPSILRRFDCRRFRQSSDEKMLSGMNVRGHPSFSGRTLSWFRQPGLYSESPAIVLRDVEKGLETRPANFLLETINLQLRYGQFISV
jgi:hypothetical protein